MTDKPDDFDFEGRQTVLNKLSRVLLSQYHRELADELLGVLTPIAADYFIKLKAKGHATE